MIWVSMWGGANTKAATSDGSFLRLIYTLHYRHKAILHGVFADVKRGLEAEGARTTAVWAVMMDEICGCFNTKRAGVLYITKKKHKWRSCYKKLFLNF